MGKINDSKGTNDTNSKNDYLIRKGKYFMDIYTLK